MFQLLIKQHKHSDTTCTTKVRALMVTKTCRVKLLYAISSRDVPNKIPLGVKITIALTVDKKPRPATHTHPFFARVARMTSIEMWLLINRAEGPVVGSRKACISFWAADKETLIFPYSAQHCLPRHTHHAKFRLRRTQGERIRRTEPSHKANSACEDRVPTLRRPHSVGSSGGMFEGDDGFLGHTSCVNKVTLVVSLPALIIYSVTEVVVMF